jgi:hypothetical protein
MLKHVFLYSIVNMALFDCLPFASVSNADFSLLYPNKAHISSFDPVNLINLLSESDPGSDCDQSDPNISISNFINSDCKYSTLDQIKFFAIFDNSFSILNINARSICKNFNKIKILLTNFSTKPDIISITESWLKPDFPASFLKFRQL